MSTFEDFIKSNERADGSLSPEFTANLIAGLKELNINTANPAATTGDANTQLNAGLSMDSTASLYNSCVAAPVDNTGGTTQTQPTDCAPQQPQPQQPVSDVGQYDPQRPYAGAGVQAHAERAFNRGDRAFNKELNLENNVLGEIGTLAGDGNSPADKKSIIKNITHEIHQAQNADKAGRTRFHNGAVALGDGGSGDDSNVEAGRGVLKPKGDLNAALKAVKTGDYALAAFALQDRQDQIKTGISAVRYGVNGGDFVDLGSSTAS